MSALGELFDSVVAAFVDAGGTSSVVFGEREPPRQDNQGADSSRIVFVPCDSDSVGALMPGQEGNAGRLQAAATIYVWACNPDDPENERAQYDATHDLFSALFVYLFRFRAGTITFGKVSRVKMLERLNGAEWKFTITLRDDLPYEPYAQTDGTLVPNPRFTFTDKITTGA